jgi:predicted RNA binding protein YcfA (HicA-like mRNA interferase family)
MRPRKLLQRLRAGDLGNVRFRDLQRLLNVCGFELDRVAGSHHIYVHPKSARSRSTSKTSKVTRSRIRFGSSFGWSNATI